MERGQHLTPDMILLFLSQRFDTVGPFDDPSREIPIGWLRPGEGNYDYSPAPRPEDESLEMTILHDACNVLFEIPNQELTTSQGSLGTVKRVAARINEWQVRVIYWDIDEDKEMARRVVAVPGSLDAELTWGSDS